MKRPKVVSDDPLMTVAEVAAELRVSKMTVYRLIHGEIAGADPIRVAKIGRSYRIPRSQVELLKEAQVIM